jgi:hypothetical protein
MDHLISAAMMTNNMYHPKHPTINSNAPPACTRLAPRRTRYPRFFLLASCDEKEKLNTRLEYPYLLQLQRLVEMPITQRPVRPAQHPTPHRHKSEYARENKIDPNSKQPKRAQGEAPDQQIQRNYRIHFFTYRPSRSVACGRV